MAKKAFIILFIAAVAAAIYLYFRRKQDQEKTISGPPPNSGTTLINWDTYDMNQDKIPTKKNIAIVLNLMQDTPGWREYLDQKAKDHRICWKHLLINDLIAGNFADKCWKDPLSYDDYALLEAIRNIRDRGFKDVVDNPEKFKDYPRGVDNPNYRENLKYIKP